MANNNLIVNSLLKGLIKKVDGLEASIVSELKQKTITILEPTEQAFAKVAEPIIQYLSSDEGNKDLELLLKYLNYHLRFIRIIFYSKSILD